MSDSKDFVMKDAEDGAASEEAARVQDETSLPKIDFATFIFSLNSSALVHLGQIADPGSGQTTRNLPLAKQTIDLMAMLEEKTSGNLTDEEAGMLKNLLYELRLIYVRESQ